MAKMHSMLPTFQLVSFVSTYVSQFNIGMHPFKLDAVLKSQSQVDQAQNFCVAQLSKAVSGLPIVYDCDSFPFEFTGGNAGIKPKFWARSKPQVVSVGDEESSLTWL